MLSRSGPLVSLGHLTYFVRQFYKCPRSKADPLFFSYVPLASPKQKVSQAFKNVPLALPKDYRWSSYGSKTGIRKEDWLDFDPCYMGLAGNQNKRAERYAEWVKGTIPEGEWELIRQSLQRGQLTGSSRFVEEIEHKIERRVEFRGQGRPRKTKK